MYLTELYNLLIRYTKDTQGKDITIDDLQQLPYWRCVWGMWQAKAHYKEDGFYERREDVPADVTHFSILQGDARTTFWEERGEQRMQVITKAECETIYGERV